MKTEEPSFEDALQRLEAIVNALEGGTLPLGESLRQFEEAITLSRHCSAQLEQAEARLEQLTNEAPQPRPVREVAENLFTEAPSPATPAAAPPPHRSPSAGWDPFAEE